MQSSCGLATACLKAYDIDVRFSVTSQFVRKSSSWLVFIKSTNVSGRAAARSKVSKSQSTVEV